LADLHVQLPVPFLFSGAIPVFFLAVHALLITPLLVMDSLPLAGEL
jgi:hypothetical protein